LDTLAQTYNVIIWKHCFPGSLIDEDSGTASVSSLEKQLQNYKLQYKALKQKMHQFPNVRFILWMGAVEAKNGSDIITEEQATRMKAFADWVRNQWDEKGDNIYI
jgi:hypothetical protein